MSRSIFFFNKNKAETTSTRKEKRKGNSTRGVIFESDFSEISPHVLPNASLPSKIPIGNWSGHKSPTNNEIIIEENAGLRGEKNAARFDYNPGQSNPTLSLYKHFEGNTYQELFIRLHFKLSDGFVIGSYDGNNGYWKFLRLWQNITFRDVWSENNPTTATGKTRYVVCTNTHSKTGSPFIQRLKPSVAANYKSVEGSSVNGQRYKYQYFPHSETTSGGYWDQHIGDQDSTGALTDPQTWHTIEYQIKLSDVGENNGFMNIWIDDIQQNPWGHIVAQGGALTDILPTPPSNHLATEVSNGGFTMITVMDNMANISSEWGTTQHSFWLNDVVISKQRIGHIYKV